MKTRWTRSLAMALAILLLAVQGYAQQTTGSINGEVTDTSGAAVPGASVTVTSPSNGLSRTVNSGSDGSYSFTDLPYGGYEIDVKASNYKGFSVKNVVVQVATATSVNAQLTIGNVAEVVTVEADAVQVQTESAAIGQVISGTQVKELPLNGRSFVQLTQLSPGVSAANNFDTKNKGLQGGVDMSVNGNPTTNNLFLIDGVNNNDTGSNRTILIYPSNEAIAEFKFLTNSYGAEYGQASGGIVSIVTRGGSNQFHGSAFYDGRNDALAAYNYFATQNAGKGLPENGKDKLRRNDWGYSVGGPIVKDKLFFFWSQEWNHEIRGRTVGACVPTAAELGGDFSTPSCSEPAAIIPQQYQAAGNTHALAALDPAATTLLKIFPAANLTTPNSSGQNWSVSLPTALYWREENIRGDYNITPRNAIMGRYTQDSWSNPSYNAGYWGDDPYPALNSSWAQPSKSIVGRWTATISNTLVNDAEFQYSNNRIIITPGGTDPGLLSTISAAIPTLYNNDLKRSPVGIPQVNLGGYSGSGGGTTSLIAPWQNQLNLYTFQDNVSKVFSRQTWKFGALIDWDGKDEDTGPASSERPTINTGDTNLALANQGGVQTGNNLANFLLPGNVFNITETSTNVRAQLRWRDYEFYATDNIKLTPRLTLDAGVRYSYMTPTFQPNNQLTSFQPALYNPNLPGSDACNGLWVAPGQDPCGAANKQFGTNFSPGTPGPNKYLVNVNNHLFAPRVGLAWDVYGNGKTAVRLGGGQFFQRERVSRYTLVSNAPFALSTQNFARTLGGATPGSLSGSASPTGGYDPRDLMPNSWQWNATVEQSVAKNTTLQMSYVGNRGIHLTSNYDINQVPQQNWLAATFANGNGVNAYRPYSNYGTLAWWTHDGNSNYNGLQLLFRTRVNQLQMTAAYTWSHSIADIILDSSDGGTSVATRTYYPNPRLDRGNGDTNRPNNFVANATYFLPSLSNKGTLLRNTAGGWELSGITSLASGNSFTIYQGGTENKANLVAGETSSLNSLTQTGFTSPLRPLLTGQSCTTNQKGNQIVNPNAFTLVGYQIGTIPGNTEPRGFCGGPKFINTDFSLDKNWKILNERATIQFRLDFFDIFNHANFNSNNGTFNPVSNVNCGGIAGTTDAGTPGYAACSATNNVISTQTLQNGFGASSATIGNASRQIQYALHINF